MPSFSDSFWSANYGPGINVLFDKLHQGCAENDQVLALAAARAEAEEAYGNKLQEIPVTYMPKKNGFGRDEGASLRKAYEGIIGEMGEEGKHHIQVAESIRRMVLVPFGKWADDHKQRVDYSHSVLKGKLKHYEKELSEVQKCQKKYFNKCRVLEDLMSEEAEAAAKDESDDTAVAETKSKTEDNAGEAAAEGESSVEMNPAKESEETAKEKSPNLASSDVHKVERKHVRNSSIVSSLAGLSMDKEQETVGPITLGGITFSAEDGIVLFQRLLDQIPQTKVKVPLLGVYDRVCSGDAIVEWIQANVPSCESLASTERLGQSLVDGGYLRLVGNLGSKFANSSVMYYQWRKKAYLQAGRTEDGSGEVSTPIMGGYLGETINSYISNVNSDEPPEARLRKEIMALDLRYKQSVLTLDNTRCDLEESITDHFKFMDRCEFDRLKAVKAVFLDFLAVLSNVIPTIQATVDKLLLYQETVHPANDLRYILESYATGPFTPKVTVYDNYYNASEDHTFGVDLELRCRGDHKKVPIVVSSILGHMDALYPEMENDEVRLGVWTVSVPLKATHALRKEVNEASSQTFPREVLGQYDPPVVASALKLWLVELPDSIIPSQHYDVIKTIYAQHANDEDPRQRVSAVQNTFLNLRVSNIATLDAIVKHLTRLVTITNAGPQYVSQVSQEFSHCFLRPRTQSALTIGDRHVYLLVHDLLTYGAQIFRELKLHNSNPSERLPIKPLSRVGRKSAEGPAKRLPQPPTETTPEVPIASDEARDKENQEESSVKEEEFQDAESQSTDVDGKSDNPIVID